MGKDTKLVLPKGTKIPDHVAIIMDGNRRWARSKGLDTLEGHKAGFDQAVKIGKAARDMGIHTVSLWGFSTENWDREKRELDYLMTLYKSMLEKYLEEAMKDEVRLIHLGRKDRLPADLIRQIAQAEEQTRHFYKHIVNICLDHGGRDDILRATKKIINDHFPVDQLDEKTFAGYLDTGGQPYPNVDLLIRTSGEQRTSGFLLWQAALAEVYWEVDHLPDFTPDKFVTAVLDYSKRRRRFGGNDKEEHVRFSPKVMAGLYLKLNKLGNTPDDVRLRDVAVAYLKEQYGLSKKLAVEGAVSFVKAMMYQKKHDWQMAKKSLEGLYGLVKKNLGLAFEPEIVADIEIDLWKDSEVKNGQFNPGLEQKIKKLYSETWRVSEFQVGKSAHLMALAQVEVAKQNWTKANWYLERFYTALKERVA